MSSSTKSAINFPPLALYFRAGVFLIISIMLFAASARADAGSAKRDNGGSKNILTHDLDITIDPDAGAMHLRDVIHVPSERITNGVLSLETSYFVPEFSPQLVGDYDALNIEEVTARDGKWSRLWDIHFNGAKIPDDGVTLSVAYSVIGEIEPQFAIRPEGSLAGSAGDAWYPYLDYSIRDEGTLTFHTRPGDLVIAPGRRASSPEQEAQGAYIFEIEQPTKFGFAAGPYRRQSSGDGSFSIYTLTDIADIQTWFSKTAAAFDALTQFYGSAPYGEAALVQVDFPTIVLGVSEQNYILADVSQFETYDFMYWAHEFAHQWWGIAIKAETGAPAGTLFTEGLAEFSALMVLETVESEAAAKAYRKGCLSGRDRGLLSRFFEQTDKSIDHALRDWDPESQDEVLAMHRLSTSKGAFVLSMLSDLIGRDKILAGLRQLIEERRFTDASWRDAETAISAAAGENLDWFFGQWLGRPGAPRLQLRWHGEDKHVAGSIMQSEPYYRLNLEIEMQGADGERKRKTIPVNGAQTDFKFKAPFEIRHLIADPDYKILRYPLASDLACGE